MWCIKVSNLAPGRPAAVRRMPCSAVSMSYARLDLRDMRTCKPFPLARSLPSTASACAGLPAPLFGSFSGTTLRSDFPPPLPAVVRLLASRLAPRQGSPEQPWQVVGSPGSRVGRFRACMGPQTARNPHAPRQTGTHNVAFDVASPPRHPGTVISRLNTQPTLSPVNASPVPSRPPAHDSKPLWLAKPSTCETLIHYNPPVSRRTMPNPSLKRSTNGMPPGPGRRYAVHFRQPGPGVMPLAPA